MPAIAALSLALSGCKDFSFFTELGVKGGLTIAPQTVDVVAGGSVQFTASGGTASYSYSLVTTLGGTINASTGLYQAPGVVGPETVRVTDGAGATAEAFLTVVSSGGSTPDYRVQNSPGPTFPSAGTGGAGFSGSFVIENIDPAEGGSSSLAWSLYVSADGNYNAGDILADTGTLGALGAGAQSGNIPFTGTWPAAGASYQLIIVLAAADDPNTANNTLASGTIPISPASLPPDYQMLSVAPTAPATATASAAFGPYDFTFQNNGGGNGTATLSWEVYLSTDQSVGGGDQLVASGTVAAGGLTVGTPITRSFSGTWPAVIVAQSWYLVARVSAVDESGLLPNSGASGAVTVDVLDVEYQIPAASVSIPPTATAGAATGAQSFDLYNAGSQTGSATIQWQVYASTNGTPGDAGDTLIAAGTRAAVTGGGTQSVSYSGTWPNDPGTAYFLVARLSSTDDRNNANNTASSGTAVTLAAPAAASVNYGGSIAAPSATRAGSAFSSSITISNAGVDPGSSTVYWSVYASLNDTTIDYGTDLLVGSGSFAALGAAPANTTKNFTSSWPATMGTYYLLAEIVADDDTDTSNNLPVGGPITVGATDYSGTVLWSSGSKAGAAFSATLTIQNWSGAQALAGAATIYWSVYASNGDTAIGAGDKLVASGSIPGGLAAGASSGALPVNNTWPLATGNFYLLADIQASDDANTTNNRPASGAVGVTGVDYAGSVSFGSGTTAGRSFDGSFNITNTGGSAGSADLYYNLYASRGNATIDTDDKVVASGTIAGGLGAGASTGNTPFANTWPATAGAYYLILEILAADDIDTTDNRPSTGAVTVNAPNVNYIVDSVTITGGTLIPGDAVSGQFVYKNDGSSDGTAGVTVSWSVYASANAFLDASDTVVATGSGLAPLNAGQLSTPVVFGGPWPLDYGDYLLIVDLTCTEDAVNPSRGATAATTIGEFTDIEPNSTYTPLPGSGYQSLGVTFKPGMSIHIKNGSVSVADNEDVYRFNTGTASQITFSVTWSSGGPDITLFLYKEGVYPANALQSVTGIADWMTMTWTVDAAATDRWFSVYCNKTNPPSFTISPYTVIITAH